MKNGILLMLAVALNVATMAQVSVNVVPRSGEAQEINMGADGEIYFINDRMMVVAGNGAGAYNFELGDLQRVTFSGVVKITDVDAEPTMRIYPNPASHMILVNGVGSEAVEFSLYTTQGVLAMRGTCRDHQAIDISQLPQGIYLVRVGSRYAKLIKQ